MIYLGIDPGAKGGISAINENGQVVFCEIMSRESLIEICKQVLELSDNKVIACVEQVHAMPGQGVTSMFNFGKSAGFIEGVLETLGIGYQLVPPQKWKKEFSLSKTDKTASINVCKSLYPEQSLLPTERCKKASDGMAESLLMATYAKRRL